MIIIASGLPGGIRRVGDKLRRLLVPNLPGGVCIGEGFLAPWVLAILTLRKRSRTGMSGQELWRLWRDQFDGDLAALAEAVWAANKLVKPEPPDARDRFYAIKDEFILRYATRGRGSGMSRRRPGTAGSTARPRRYTATGSLWATGSIGSTVTCAPWRWRRSSPRRARRGEGPPSTSGLGSRYPTPSFSRCSQATPGSGGPFQGSDPADPGSRSPRTIPYL